MIIPAHKINAKLILTIMLQPVHDEGEWFMKGALEMVFKHCSLLYSTSTLRLLTDRDRGHFESVAAEMGRHGLRGIVRSTLVFNFKYVFLFLSPFSF